MIEEIKELLRCYEYCHDENNPQNIEIQMWRTKFLNTRNEEFQVNMTFRSLPSTEFCHEDPEIIIQNLKKMREIILKTSKFKT